MRIVVFYVFASALFTLGVLIVVFVAAPRKIHSHNASSIAVAQVLFRTFGFIAMLFEFDAIFLPECDMNDRRAAPITAK